MKWHEEYVYLGLVLLVVLALTSQTGAAVGRSTDDEYAVTLLRNGERGVMRSTGPAEQTTMGDQHVATGLNVWQSAPQQEKYSPTYFGQDIHPSETTGTQNTVLYSKKSQEWVVDQTGTLRPVETTNIVVVPPPITQAAPEPQQSGISTTVNGIDQIETKAILPEALAVDQLDAVKKIADNGTLIAQQRFAVEQYKINSEAGLEYLRIVKNFILWGFLASIPFVVTVYCVFKGLLTGYHNLQKDRLDYKLKELESSERIVRG